MKINRQLLCQIFLYGIIGAFSAGLDIALFFSLHKILNINEFIANIISVHAGIAMSFFLNRKYNFKKIDKVFFRATSFYLTGLIGLALSESLLWLGVKLMLPIMITKIISVFIVAGFQFLFNKSIAFGR